MKHRKTGELEFESYEESSMYFAKLLAINSNDSVKSLNMRNVNTYKEEIVELRNVNYVIPGGRVLSENPFHRQQPFWAISETLSEILNLSRPIMERYSPETMDWAYNVGSDRQPEYAYGERWHVHNQLLNIFRKLGEKPTTKKAHLQIYDGSDTGFSRVEIPCTIGHTLSIRDDRLDITAYFRSQDFFAGNLYDTFLANFLQNSFVSWLKNSGHENLQCGDLHFVVNSLHYYPSKSSEKLEKMIAHGETDFYSNTKPYEIDRDITGYFEDLYHLSDSEQAAYHHNFKYAEVKREKIVSPVFKDFSTFYLIKNAKYANEECLETKYREELLVPEIRKWVNKL